MVESHFFNLLINALTRDFDPNVSYVSDQASDRARTMSGQLKELQTRVKESCSEYAFYVHCCAHNINLTFIDAVCCFCSNDVFWDARNLILLLNIKPPKV